MPPPKFQPPPKFTQKQMQNDLFTAIPSNPFQNNYRKGSIQGFTPNSAANTLTTHTMDKCSVPSKDVQCYISTNVNDTDSYTKHFVKSQISKKIYAWPEKHLNMHVTPNKCAEDFGMKTNFTSIGVKINKKHFKEKIMDIDDIDVESLARPMRSSTPTLSISGSTILAGHLDWSLDELDDDNSTLNKVETGSDDNTDSDDEMFQQYLQRPRQRSAHSNKQQTPEKKNPETQISTNDKYRNDWIKKEEGVSTNNCDAPPSLYVPSVALSDSLMDITSVSRNVTPVINKDHKHNPQPGRSIITGHDYNNTKFM